MGILDIPNELLLVIVRNLSVQDLSHFLSTCRKLSSLLTPHLHDLGVQDVGGLTALQWAAERGYAPLAELAISRGAEIGKANPEDLGRTPLHSAALYNHHAVVRVLVQHGAGVNGKDFCGMTALHLAAWSGGLETTRILLERGADMTCLAQAGETPAHIAARMGNVTCMESYIAAGFNLNTRGHSGGTVLHSAAGESIEMVEYLLGQKEVKMAINAKDRLGSTPLHLAVSRPDIVRLLLHHGADIEVENVYRNTPAHSAVCEEIPALESVRAFLDAGFDVTTRGNHGRTVLHYAAVNLGEDVVEYLLEQPGVEAIINAKDSAGLTPLTWVASRCTGPRSERLVSVLVHHGAEPETEEARTRRARWS